MKKLIGIIIVLVLLLFVSLQPRAEERPKYSIVFYSNGGTQVQTIKVDSNMKAYAPQDPVRTSSDFLGWHTSPTFEEDTLFNFNQKINRSLTLYARWGVTQYKIEYELNGGFWPSEEVEAKYVNVLDFESLIVYFKFSSQESPAHPGGRTNAFQGWRTISQAEYNLLSNEEKANYPYIERIRPKDDNLDELFDETLTLVLYAHYRNIN